MKHITGIFLALLSCSFANAQVAQWLVPPEYDYIEASPANHVIMAQQGFTHHVWDMNGKCLAKVSDDLYPYSEGYAVSTVPETASITAIYDTEGKKTSVSDYHLQLGWGYPMFHDNFLLVHDGNYFYYMDPEGGVDDTPYYYAYPFSHGYAACYSFGNIRKMKDPFYALLNTNLERIPLTLDGKTLRSDDIEFISSVSDQGLAVVAVKGKLYFFDAATAGLSPLMASEDDTNIKNQARPSSSIENCLTAVGDTAKVLTAKAGKERLRIYFDAVTMRPTRIESDNNVRTLEAPKTITVRSTPLKAVRDDAAKKYALYMNDREILPPQLDIVERCEGNNAWVVLNDKRGLLQVNAADQFTFSINAGEGIGFRHKHFFTTIRLNMPSYIDANATSIEIEPETGCNIDKRSKEARNNTDGSYVQYNCALTCPQDVGDESKDIAYPAYIVYQGLRTPMTQAVCQGWHSKYFTVDVNEQEIKMTGNTISFTVNISADRIPGEEVYPFVPSLATEGLTFEMEKVSDIRYKCTVHDLKKGVNNIIVRVTEEGCPPSDYTFEVTYHPRTPQGDHQVTVVKKPDTPQPQPQRPVLRI